MAALHYRRRTGKGQFIDFAQAENLMQSIGESLMDYTMNGRVQTSLGNRHPFMAPHGCYPCRGSDRWVIIATERAKRPIHAEASEAALCPFCAGNENMTPPEVLVFRDQG